MRIPLVAGNWKMNTTVTEAVSLVEAMKQPLDAIVGAEKVVCPPFISLSPVSAVLKGTSIKLGAQNCYFESKGAFTGEISPAMLAPLCQYVILGHSERRTILGEDDTVINRKVRAAMEAGLSVILCVGENLEEREAGRTAAVVISQVQAGLDDVTDAARVVVAYEPLWAVGTGQAATGHQANHVAVSLRSYLTGMFGPDGAQLIRILYGGSVTGENVNEFVKEPEIDGALVGGASLKPDDFVQIAAKAAASVSLQ